MPHLTRGPVQADEGLRVDDDPSADAGRDGDVDRAARPDRGAEAPLRHHRHVRIPLQEGGQVELTLDALDQRHVAPACQVRGRDHDATPRVEWPRGGDADPDRVGEVLLARIGTD